jgi:hypothetical protein
VKNPHKTIRAFAFGTYQYSSDTNTPFDIEVEITDLKLVPEIISGKYRGLSPSYIVREWECSICHGDLEECPHDIGKQYGGIACQMIAKNIEPIEISVVDIPQDPRCRIIDFLIVKNGKHAEYVWYGFEANTELDRFKNIQKAKENGLIPEKAAFFFAEFFSNNSQGKAIFP